MADEHAEELNAYERLAPEAVKAHVAFEEMSIVPGFRTFSTDVDVYLGLYETMMPAGSYMLKEGDELATARIYQLVFDGEEIARVTDGKEKETRVDESGNVMHTIKEPVEFSAKLEPIPTADGNYLTFPEFAAWLAINTADDDETRDAIFRSVYQVTRRDDEGREKPPKQAEAKPTWRHDPITKLAQSLSNPALYGEFGTISLDVAGKADRKRKRTVETVVALEYIGNDEDVTLARPVSEFDLQVLNGYIAQVAAGRSMFTATDVFEAVTGGGKPTEKQKREYTESLDRMRFNKLTVDMTAEAEAHNLVDPETGRPWKSWKVETMLVPADKVTMTSPNGRIVEGYVNRGEPVVYTHARMTKQIVSYPLRYLDTKDAGSNTQQNIIIRGYLLKRILQARDNPRMRPTIKYATIYDKAGIDKGSKQARKRANDYIERLLNVWVNMGLISGYAIEKERRQISKVTVTFPKEPR